MNDEVFFERVEQIRKKMFAIAFSYFKSESMAIDMVDEAVYKGFLKKRSLRQEEFFETWLIRILMNTCATHYKKESRHRSYEEFVVEHSSELELNTQKLELMDAVSRLPEDLRKIITIKYFGGYTNQEIASTLKIPMGTVASRIRRALELLRTDLEEKK
ncbi:MAG: RNA polymerase sigma factor [Clostridiales bacterium]|nr:RNA polymerase sigma factor [Clostridiales bacterium]